MASVIQNGNYFLHNENPNERVNPTQVGAIWVNYTTAKQYVCQDNTLNKNKWVIMNPDVDTPENIIKLSQYFLGGIDSHWVTHKRKLNVHFRNTTGRTIFVNAYVYNYRHVIYLVVNNKISNMFDGLGDTSQSFGMCLTGIVPKNGTYYYTTGKFSTEGLRSVTEFMY